MNAFTLKEAQLKLQQVVERATTDAEPTIIVTERGEQVVLLPLDEYNSWKETLYLLSSPANAERLRKSIAEVESETPRRDKETPRSGEHSSPARQRVFPTWREVLSEQQKPSAERRREVIVEGPPRLADRRR